MIRPISGTTRVAAVIGSPVEHSLSPALHNAAFEAAGLDWRFLAFEVAPGRAARALDAMRTLDIGGYAVTMPHKTDVAALVDEVDEGSAALRSVNTVLLRDDGSILGTSTDGPGFVDSVVETGFEPVGARVVVLGAGGAARAIVDALGRAGVDDIAIVNRTATNAEAAAALAPVARVGVIADVAEATLLVNSTPIGMGADALPLDAGWLRPDLAVADNVYHPLDTTLLRAARAAGAHTIDGLGMLVHQAARQQELWTGIRPDTGLMRAAAERALVERAATAHR